MPSLRHSSVTSGHDTSATQRIADGLALFVDGLPLFVKSGCAADIVRRPDPTLSEPHKAVVEPMMAFGLIIAVTRSSEDRIIGNSYVPKDLPKEGRREIPEVRAREDSTEDRSMFASKHYRKHYRAQAAEYKERADRAITLTEKRKFQNLEQSFVILAENEEWLSTNHDKTVHRTAEPAKSVSSLPPKRR